MAEFAQFIALTETDAPADFGGRLFTFDLRDLDPARTVIVQFKVSGPQNSQLQMSFNHTQFSIDFILDSTFTRPRSWHEIVEGSRFRSAGNEVIVQGQGGDGGGVTVSDLVILYHAKTPD